MTARSKSSPILEYPSIIVARANDDYDLRDSLYGLRQDMRGRFYHCVVSAVNCLFNFIGNAMAGSMDDWKALTVDTAEMKLPVRWESINSGPVLPAGGKDTSPDIASDISKDEFSLSLKTYG
jgi:hypothetical protein